MARWGRLAECREIDHLIGTRPRNRRRGMPSVALLLAERIAMIVNVDAHTLGYSSVQVRCWSRCRTAGFAPSNFKSSLVA